MSSVETFIFFFVILGKFCSTQPKNNLNLRRCGMSADDIFNVIAYGWSNKTNNPEMIGMYGNGLKSGSMRVANDCLILTKKNNECSALMISRTFIENPDNKEVNTINIISISIYASDMIFRLTHR